MKIVLKFAIAKVLKVTLQIVNKACYHKICNSPHKRKGYAIGQREQTTVTLFNEFSEVKASMPKTRHRCRN